jgi:hypothetical protein
MPTKFLILFNNLLLNPRRVFLIDSFGAFLTAFVLGAILSKLQKDFGMTQEVLYPLAIVALVYAIYSIGCYFGVKENWRPYLLALIIANLVYSCITIGLVILFYHRLTSLGLTYFLGEVIVIGGLIFLEALTIFKSKEMHPTNNDPCTM